MASRVPSEGTKVTLGKNAPVKREGAGVVAPDSLAAESVQGGGEFANNANINMSSHTFSTSSSDKNNKNDKNNKSSSDVPASAPPHEPADVGHSSGLTSDIQGQDAPTYVNNQHIRDAAGPHGKNITEDPDMTGRPAKFDVEVGSQDDPARLAELKMQTKQARVPGIAGTEAGVQGGDEQPYGALGGDTSA